MNIPAGTKSLVYKCARDVSAECGTAGPFDEESIVIISVKCLSKRARGLISSRLSRDWWCEIKETCVEKWTTLLMVVPLQQCLKRNHLWEIYSLELLFLFVWIGDFLTWGKSAENMVLKGKWNSFIISFILCRSFRSICCRYCLSQDALLNHILFHFMGP